MNIIKQVKMSKDDSSFGETVRRLRENKKINLRTFAQIVGMSPAYLSKIERDEFPPPADGKVRTIADALGQDADQLLALIYRDDVPSVPLTSK